MNKFLRSVTTVSALTASLGGGTIALAKPASLVPALSQSVGVAETDMLACIDSMQPVTAQSIWNNGFEGRAGAVRCHAGTGIIGLNMLFAVAVIPQDTAVYQMITVTPQAVKINDYRRCVPEDICFDRYETNIPAYQVAFSRETMLDERRPKSVKLDMEQLPPNIRTSMAGALAARKKLNAQLWQFKH